VSGVAAAASLIFKLGRGTAAPVNDDFESRSTSSSGFIRATAKVLNGAECSITSGFVTQDSHVDAGVLGCGMGETCVEDSSSSLGGRCIKSLQRHLAATNCTFANGTDGVKCDGANACLGSNLNNVGCGSCIGKEACPFMTIRTVGENSCIGPNACDNGGHGSIDDNSCVGKYSCSFMIGTVGENSCIGESACNYSPPVSIGQNSCIGLQSCFFMNYGE
jgi:hypothetical protein